MPCVPQGNATQHQSAIIGTIVVLTILVIAWILLSTAQGIGAKNAKKDATALVLANQLRQLPVQQQVAAINQSDELARVAEQLGDGYVVNNKASYVNSVWVANKQGRFFQTLWVTQVTDRGQETHKYKLVH